MVRNSCFGLLPLAAIFLSGWSSVAAEVKTVRVPQGGNVPEVVVDGKGVVHMAYGAGGQPGNAMYVRSTDGGKTFSRPVQINKQADIVTIGMERGPKLAVGKDGVIHVLWMGFYKKGGGIWYNRSTDDGKTFEQDRNLLEPNYGADNATIAADADGNVFALWTGGFPGVDKDPKSPFGAPLIWVKSADNGKTFIKNELVKYNHPTRVCECCRLEAKLSGDKLVVAFRGAWQSNRDPYLMIGDKAKNDFRVIPVSPDGWKTNCPMQGIPFAIDPKGRVLVSWMSRGKAFWSISDEAVKAFSKPNPAPDTGSQAAMPQVVLNQKGEVLLVWKAGDQVTWAVFGKDGKPTKDTGKAGQLAGTNKPTAYVGSDDNFYIVF